MVGPAVGLLGHQMLGNGITPNHEYEFTEENGQTVLRHSCSAFGPLSDELVKGIEWHGSLDTFDEQLHAWIERGEVIPPPDD